MMNSAASSDKLVREMLTHLEPPIPVVDRHPESKLADFYADKSVFITGATGFIGKALIEKLVRSCDKIKRIYILVRKKRGKDVGERVEELIKSECFDRIRKMHNGSSALLEQKLCPIEGDITLPKFGVTSENLKELSDECSLVINSAATIRFVEPIDIAVRNNIYSVGQLIDFCDELQNLQAILHLSTAYSNCHKRDTIHEMFYQPPMSGNQVQESLAELKAIQGRVHEYKEAPDKCDDGTSRCNCKLQPLYFDGARGVSEAPGRKGEPYNEYDHDLLSDFTHLALVKSNRPNTYTFTKAISENYLLDKVLSKPQRYLADKIPVAIIRPSIVGGAWREPIVGLVDNFNGPTGAILSLYTGALQAMPGNGQRVADIVPVDMVANMVLAAGWFLVERSSLKNAAKMQSDQGVYLFNFVSGARNPLRWHVVTDNIAKLANKFPSKFLMRLPSSYFIHAGRFYDLYDLINQKLPAYLSDLVRVKLLGQRLDRKSSAMAAYSRIREMTTTLTPFTSNQWQFSDANVRLLFDFLTPIDKSVFHFDVSSISWPDYIASYIIGSRIYTLRDGPQNLAKALETIKRRKLTNNLSFGILFVIIYYIFFAGCHLESAILGN